MHDVVRKLEEAFLFYVFFVSSWSASLLFNVAGVCVVLEY